MRRLFNRGCLILCLAFAGVIVCCFVVEAFGYLLPIEHWLSAFSSYALIFYFGYRLSHPK